MSENQKLDCRMFSKCESYDYAGCLKNLYAKTPYLSFSLPIHDINLNIEVENDRFFACITERQGEKAFSLYVAEQVPFQTS
ncbi:Uncharacterised protein [Klebsiella variicola]|nr:Uncharacterised protein [Klebsiella variicola]